MQGGIGINNANERIGCAELCSRPTEQRSKRGLGDRLRAEMPSFEDPADLIKAEAFRCILTGTMPLPRFSPIGLTVILATLLASSCRADIFIFDLLTDQLTDQVVFQHLPDSPGAQLEDTTSPSVCCEFLVSSTDGLTP